MAKVQIKFTATATTDVPDEVIALVEKATEQKPDAFNNEATRQATEHVLGQSFAGVEVHEAEMLLERDEEPAAPEVTAEVSGDKRYA